MTKRDGNPPDFVLDTMSPAARAGAARADPWNLAIQQATGGGSVETTSPPRVAPHVTELIVRDMQRRGEAPPKPSAAKVRFVRLAGGAEAPSRAHPDDAGYDLVVSRDVRIAANSFEDVHSDIAVELPAGYWARVTGRSSSLRVHGLLVSEGVIDGGYRGELFVGVWNLRGVPVTVKAGWRIAQIIIVPLVALPWTEVTELGESGRGRNGFGSTGV